MVCRFPWRCPGGTGAGRIFETNHFLYLKALRGSADSFGIITHFHLKTVAAPESVVLFSLDIAGIGDDVEEATQAFLHVQRVIQDSSIIDQRLSFGFFIQNGNWTIWGVYLGEKDHLENLVSICLRLGV